LTFLFLSLKFFNIALGGKIICFFQSRTFKKRRNGMETKSNVPLFGLTLACYITLAGAIAGILFFPFFIFFSKWQAIACLAFLAISDLVDGKIARKRKEVSLVGHFLDRIVRDSVLVAIFLFIFLIETKKDYYFFMLIFFGEAIFLGLNLKGIFVDGKRKNSFYFYCFWNLKQAFYFVYCSWYLLSLN